MLPTILSTILWGTRCVDGNVLMFGMLLFGILLFGMVWFNMVMFGMLLFGMLLLNTVMSGMLMFGMLMFGMLMFAVLMLSSYIDNPAHVRVDWKTTTQEQKLPSTSLLRFISHMASSMNARCNRNFRWCMNDRPNNAIQMTCAWHISNADCP